EIHDEISIAFQRVGERVSRCGVGSHSDVIDSSWTLHATRQADLVVRPRCNGERSAPYELSLHLPKNLGLEEKRVGWNAGLARFDHECATASGDAKASCL